jgi:hypothetical protein
VDKILNLLDAERARESAEGIAKGKGAWLTHQPIE